MAAAREGAGPVAGNGLSRRDALKLAGGVVALSATLGIPIEGLAGQQAGGATYQFKFYRKPQKLLQTIDAGQNLKSQLEHESERITLQIQRAGTGTVSFPFPANAVQAKRQQVSGQAGADSRFEARFVYNGKLVQAAPLNDEVACLLENEGRFLEIRLFQGKEDALIMSLPADMAQGKCPG